MDRPYTVKVMKLDKFKFRNHITTRGLLNWSCCVPDGCTNHILLMYMMYVLSMQLSNKKFTNAVVKVLQNLMVVSAVHLVRCTPDCTSSFFYFILFAVFFCSHSPICLYFHVNCEDSYQTCL